MLVYRARLEPGVQAVLSASLRLWGALPGGSDMRRLRATVRYLLASGAVRTHRGWMAAALPEGVAPVLMAWQLEGEGALLTFRTPPPARPGGREQALTDRFCLPLSLEAWGVTALTSAHISVVTACRAAGESLRLRGSVTIRLATQAAAYPIRIPFCRTVAVPGGLAWRAHGGVTALRWRVAEGGRISGEVALTFRYEGRPPRGGTGAPDLAAILRIRDLTGRVLTVDAEHAGDGQVVVRGTLELELWWLDREGRSRMSSRTVRFSTLLALPGACDGDRLEANARLERLTPAERHGAVDAQVMLAITVTALRETTVLLAGAPYRLSQVAGSGSASLLLNEGFTAAPEPAEQTTQERVVLLPPPAGDWQQAMSWEAPGEMAMEAVSEAGVQVRGRIPAGPLLAARRLQAGDPTELILPAPGPVRRVLDLQRWPLAAMVQLESGMHLITAQARPTQPVDAILAYPVLHGGTWQLRVWVT